MGKPLVVGHRGAMGYAPENTLASFKKGWRLGVDAVECDVHLSKDGQLVVIHDGVLDRTTDGKGRVRDKSWRSLSRLDAGSWFSPEYRGEKLLRLPDLLKWLRNKKSPSGKPLGLLVEIKNKPAPYPGIAKRVIRALVAGKMVDRTLVISFDHEVIREIKRACPSLRAGILFHKEMPNLKARLNRTRADAILPLWKLLSPRWAREARSLNRFIGVWTVNEPRDMRRVVRLGVDAITSNYPDRLRRVLENECG